MGQIETLTTFRDRKILIVRYSELRKPPQNRDFDLTLRP